MPKKKDEPFVAFCRDVLQEYGENLEIPEIRVWCHAPGGDGYHKFKSFDEAIRFIATNKGAEKNPLLAFRGWEINLWSLTPAKPREKKTVEKTAG